MSFRPTIAIGAGLGIVMREAKAVPKTKAGKQAKMHKTMGEFKRGKLHSGSKSGPVVKNKKQAIAIGLRQSGRSKHK